REASEPHGRTGGGRGSLGVETRPRRQDCGVAERPARAARSYLAAVRGPPGDESDGESAGSLAKTGRKTCTLTIRRSGSQTIGSAGFWRGLTPGGGDDRVIRPSPPPGRPPPRRARRANAFTPWPKNA